MTYATRQDLVDRFGESEISALAPADETPDRALSVLADAAAEIDGVLAHGYDLPLPFATYPLLVPIACDIARHRLYDQSEPEAVKERALRARAKLQSISSGKYVLVSSTGAVVPRRADARVVAKDQEFKRSDATSGRIEGLDGF